MVGPLTNSEQKHDAERSPDWPAFRDRFIAANPVCVACGSRVGLQAHHIFPFHYCIALGRPDLELDARNLIALCETGQAQVSENHHLLVGHLADFESSNLDVTNDAKVTYHRKTAEQILADAEWEAKRKARLPHIEAMTPADKAAFTWAMNHRFPSAAHPAAPKPATLPDWIPADQRTAT